MVQTMAHSRALRSRTPVGYSAGVGFVDLHCHWLVAHDDAGAVTALDDGSRALADSRAMLEGLGQLGFELVHATPHMRPGMFDLDKPRLEKAYADTTAALGPSSVQTALAAEHFFDDVVFTRIQAGHGLPFPRRPLPDRPASPRPLTAILVEFPRDRFPLGVVAQFQRLLQRGYLPVLAHPERYRPVWDDDRCLDPLLEAGAVLLLDACSVVGKYGRASEAAARKLLDDGAYQAACSDAHRPGDIAEVERSLRTLETLTGKDEMLRLFDRGPREILAGAVV